jgi:hypothetical protein
MCTLIFQKYLPGSTGKKIEVDFSELDVIFELFLTLKSKTKLIPIVPKQHDFVRNHKV